ncbi:MAG: N-acetyl-gamma-glutamyl-phosphate reductase [Armatimonadota bacterium]
MTKVAIFGASGYGGVELARVVHAHPEFELTYLAGHSTAGKKLGEVYPHAAPLADMLIEAGDFETAAAKADVLVFALHPGDGTAMVAQSVAAGKKTLDFSADFRLNAQADYERYYGVHPMPELIGKSVYGLPELHREAIKATNFVAVPGCYPTSGTLALSPAVAYGLVDTKTLIVDSMSGVSGAGRKLALGSHFSEVNESLTAYKVASHRHTPEMNQELSFAAAEKGLPGGIKVTFTPHLVPITRGILTTAYGSLTSPMKAADALAIYQDFYAGEPCVRVLPLGQMPTTKAVSGTNRCDIGLAIDEDNERLIVVAAIDNLIKGLSGAALQCMNLMCGYDETLGLPMMAMWP